MNNREIKAMMAELAPVIREFTEAALKPIMDRIASVEDQLKNMPIPKDGKDADLSEVKEIVAAQVNGIRAAMDALPPALGMPDVPKMIEDALAARLDVKDMQNSIEEVVRAVVAEIPAPINGKDGASVTFEDVAPALQKQVDAFLHSIPAPQDGKSADPEEFAALIASEVAKRVSELPKAKDGIDGKDGLDVKEMFRAEGGKLIAVMSDGTTRDLGVFVGRDGDPGTPGLDGVGFDDLEAVYDGEKSITLKFVRGENVKTFTFTMPVVLDRGVYREGKEYAAGDGVTWAGSFWIAQKDTASKPDTGADWRLSVKRGRDGKDGVVKELSKPTPVRVGNAVEGRS